jgi:AraC-like DNA-binding protein
MPGSTILLCNEPDEFEAALSHGSHVELLVTGGGQFQARLIRISLPRMSLLTIEETLPRISFVSPATGSLVAIVPLAGEPPQVWAGIPLRDGTIITIEGGQHVHARTLGPSHSSVVCLAGRDLIRYGRALVGPGFVVPAGLQFWQPAPADLRSMQSLLKAAVHVTVTRPAAPANAEAAHGLEQELITSLVDCLSVPAAPAYGGAWKRGVELMARLESILRGHPERLPSVADLGASLGVSVRTLWSYCDKHLGMGPSQYLRLRRLQRINQRLRHADAAGASVSEIARRHG